MGTRPTDAFEQRHRPQREKVFGSISFCGCGLNHPQYGRVVGPHDGMALIQVGDHPRSERLSPKPVLQRNRPYDGLQLIEIHWL